MPLTLSRIRLECCNARDEYGLMHSSALIL